MSRYPFVKQHDEKDCGAAAVSMLCRYWGLKLPLAQIRGRVKTDVNGTTMYGLTKGLSHYGFSAEGAQGTVEDLLFAVDHEEVKLPVIARIIKDDILEHFVVVYNINDRHVIIGDPAVGIIKLKMEEFTSLWTGHIVQAVPDNRFKKADHTKGSFRKYLDLVFAQKKLLVFAIIASLIISIITMAGSMAFYTIVEVLSDTGGNEHIHEEYTAKEDSTGDDLDEDNFVAVWENKLITWLDEQPIIQAIDKVIMNVDLVLFSILVMYLFRLLVNIMRGKVLARLSQNVENGILFQSYEKLLDLPAHFFESRSTGEIMSRFDDITEICNAVSGGSLTLVLDTFMALITGCILICLNKDLAVWSMLIVLVYLLVIVAFKMPIARLSQAVMSKNAIITSIIKQTVDGIVAIKSCADKKEKSRLVCGEYAEYTRLKVQASVLETVQNSIVTFVAVSGLTLILWKGSAMCAEGMLSLSILITFYNIMNYFLTSVTNLISLQSDVQTAIISAERLNDILDCCDKKTTGVTMKFSSGDIEFQNIAFRYGGGPLLFEGINFKIRQGEKIALVGESGCGKTTIAKLLSGFYSTESGEVRINGIPIDMYSENDLKAHVAYIPGNGVIFEDSIINNIVLHNASISPHMVQEVCKQLQIDDFIQSLPYGYDTLIDDNGSIFSSGQRQRINLARALVHMPDIIILDEATSNLDPISEKKINDVINGLRGRVTCIMIAHKLRSIKDCDRIFVLSKGKIIAEGTHEDLLSQCPLYKSYLDC